MKKPICFDVLVVYNEKLSHSASDSSTKNPGPFSSQFADESYNVVYGYFLATCRKFKIKAALTTSADIIGPGLCRSFWSFKAGQWLRVNKPCFSTLIFDKFAPSNQAIKVHRRLLFSSKEIKPFNNSALFSIFFDKQKTYAALTDHAIPTVSLQDKSLPGVKDAHGKLLRLLRKQAHPEDFTAEIVMKDRFGAGGNNVYKFKKNQLAKMSKTALSTEDVSFILQPFVKFDRGFIYQNSPQTTDIRFVYLGNKLVQSYIRVAKLGDFRCNEHAGGLLTYLSLDEMPHKLIEKTNLIARQLDQRSSLFSLDFIVSNNGNIYFLEGNTMPGLDWNMSLRKNEIESKKLIELVVKEIMTKLKRSRAQRVAKKLELPKTNIARNKYAYEGRTVFLH